MIPLTYQLHEGVRVEPADGVWRAVCDLPLGVVKVNAAAARLLELTRNGSAVAELAAALGSDEERVLWLCEYFRRRGMLEVLTSPGDVLRDARSSAGDATCRARTCPSDLQLAPSVSVIVPTKDRAAELDACLAALFALDYPADLLEVIVIDDGSGDETAGVAAGYPCLYLANDRNRGQSYSRNAGARRATGEVLAFIDSDCVADPDWLRELVPFFAWPRVAAVGGYVAGFHDQTRLDRYEQVASPLNMGERLVLAADDPSSFYAPTCNLLVRREAYLAVGGLREELRVGEDVDLCWRLRRTGWYLVYSPSGRVLHRHRTRLTEMLHRRAQYGTSEPILQALHPEKRKLFALRVLPVLTFGVLAAALVAVEPRLLLFCLVPAMADGLRGWVRLARAGAGVSARRVWFAVARAHLSFIYSAFSHLVRYYLLVLVAGGFVTPGFWLLAAGAVSYVAAVDYTVRRPRLGFGTFLLLSLAEHTAYQIGVALGCLRMRSLRSYGLKLRWVGAPGRLAYATPRDPARLWRAGLGSR